VIVVPGTSAVVHNNPPSIIPELMLMRILRRMGVYCQMVGIFSLTPQLLGRGEWLKTEFNQ
jgi:hypothetical protein